MKAAKLKVPKMKYVFHAMVSSPGGTAKASAVLKAQFEDYVEIVRVAIKTRGRVFGYMCTYGR